MVMPIIADIILQGMPGDFFDSNPQITALDGGGFVVTWQAIVTGMYTGSANTDVFVQQFDADGAVMGPAVRLQGVVGMRDTVPQVTSLAGGGFAVTWMGDVLPTELEHPADIFVQLFSTDGSMQGSPVRLQGMMGMWDYDPQITGLEGGGFVVAWYGQVPGVTDSNVFVQRFDADGATLGNPIRLQGMAGLLWDGSPQIAALDGGGFVVTWTGNTSDGQSADVFMQRFDAEGSAVGSLARLQGMAGSFGDGSPQIAALDGGGFVVTWTGNTSDGQSADVFMQRFDAEGSAVGSLARLQGMAGSFGDGPSQIISLDGGGLVVVWGGDTSDGQGTDIFVQRFDADGAMVGGVVRLQGVAGYLRDMAPQVTALDGGGFVVAWYADTSTWRGYDIIVQRFDADGVAIGDMVLLQGAAGYYLDDFVPQITALDGGGFVVTWYGQTTDGQSYDIFVQRFDADGTPISMNYTPIGEVAISGLVRQGEVLIAETSTIADADGLGYFSYQWFADGVAISGATGGTYIPGYAQIGQEITVQISYTDRQGTSESLTSAPTVPVDFGVSFESAETFVLPDNGHTTDLTLIGSAGIDGTGNTLDNLLVGNRGNNGLFGGAGNDTLQGDAGNDTLNGDDGGDLLYGGAGDDLMFGGQGSDTLRGEAGADTLRGGGLRDLLYGGAQSDLLQGDGGNDALFGGGGADMLYGGEGNDRLVGGTGKDVLYGGAGADQFVFRSAAEAGGGGGRDVIADFEVGLDKINLRLMQDGLSFIGSAAFSGTAGQVRYHQGTSLVQGDLDGDGVADFAIEVTGSLALTAADFLL
ncbi:calcium-binding protein [Ruixingdingia sedimenti]|uniref:M10 family metallopeptidase C-terminal domain-containing protein n=1 Tax=Ruixingdingia sedimenti TaxID=3073604 RepID=A0ABU1FE08_9RHOB|nr:M10 family metallopeptidase C-terminal domain-containing protein [Xinfangfangia sp. LG-4]MDR5655122.1 M10 family metallopeptidase C-terminal domain-containing protein [Xinfangfangia sp. LG-4]